MIFNNLLVPVPIPVHYSDSDSDSKLIKFGAGSSSDSESPIFVQERRNTYKSFAKYSGVLIVLPMAFPISLL